MFPASPPHLQRRLSHRIVKTKPLRWCHGQHLPKQGKIHITAFVRWRKIVKTLDFIEKG